MTTSPAGGRVPLFAPFSEVSGPTLSLGMLTAAARGADGGRLEEAYDIRRPEPWSDALAALARHEGPAVVLCSSYVWNVDRHLEAARQAVQANPRTLVVHGGPSTPKYDEGIDAFLRANSGCADVLVHGEGEATLVELLMALQAELSAGCRPEEIEPLPGTTTRSAGGGYRRGPDRARIDDLDSLPSPFLTGELDHLGPRAWRDLIYIEATRGCPYGCSFCDWGSATLSRVRKFSLDRIEAEVEWCATHGFSFVGFTDANFGMISRDVEIVRRVRDVYGRHGLPDRVLITPAKNTTRHLTKILDVLTEAGISYQCQLGIQTTDPTTLEVLQRSNIPVDHFVRLAAELRRRRHLLECDLLLGLPGQSFDSFRTDLQFMIDHEINHKTWITQVLPNAPMNDPAYRAEHQIETDDANRVVATASFSREERERMLRLLEVEIIANRLGVLRQLLRYLQWDHGVAAVDVLQAIVDLPPADFSPYPLIRMLFTHYASHPIPPVGWRSFYAEVGRFATAELGVPQSSDLQAVLHLEEFLRPAPGRRFPASLPLAHDVVAYVRSALRRLYADGVPTGPDRPLRTYGPGELTVADDPLGLCRSGPYVPKRSRSTTAEVTAITTLPHELLHPLTMTYDSPALVGIADPVDRRRTEEYLGRIADSLVAEAQVHHPDLFVEQEEAPAPSRTVVLRRGRPS